MTAHRRVPVPGAASEERGHGGAWRVRAASLLALGVGLVLVLLPTLVPDAAPPEAAARPAGVALATLGLRAAGWLPPRAAALPVVLTALLIAAAPVSLVHTVATSTAVWLVAGGMVMGIAVKVSGLGARLARTLVARIGGSYAALIAGIVAVGLALAFVMPSSMGRTVLLTPVVLSLARALGYRQGTRGYDGLILATGLVCIVPAMAILPATVPNVVMLGAAEAQFDVTLRYFDFLVAHGPGTGLVRALVVGLVVWLVHRQAPRAAPPEAGMGRLSGAEKRLAVILGLALVLWATDSLHHLSPAWIAMGAAVLCLLPPRPIIPARGLERQVNVKALAMVAALVGLGAGVAESGLAGGIGSWAVRVLPLSVDSPGWFDAALVGLTATLVSLLVTTPGAAAVLTPMAGDLAAASGLPLETVLMAEVMGYATAVLPYQVPPLLVAMAMGAVSFKAGARITLCVALASLLLSWPVTLGWWAVLGLFGQAP